MQLSAVFLDREGVITPKLGKGEYLLRPEQAILDRDAGAALQALQRAVPLLFIVSNQSCVSRGLIPLSEVEVLHRIVLDRLAEEGVHIRASRICSHVDADACDCRKPKPGMILSLCAEYGIDPGTTAMIGDSPSDVQAGADAGCAISILLTDTPVLFGSSYRCAASLMNAVASLTPPNGL